MTEERIYPPMHPGRVLELEFLEPLGLTPYKLAKEIGVPAPRVYDLVRGKRGISADTALGLARFFGTSARFWMNLQTHYDLEIEEDRVGDSLEKEIQPFAYTPPE
jgi:addiction module HigA family antidote